MTLTLETPRLILRRLRETDLETFLAYRNDPEVYRYQGWNIPYLRADAVEFIARLQETQPGAPGAWTQLALECRETGEILGDIAFHPTRAHPHTAYLGYTLARRAWGQGYASEAARATLDYLFRVLDLHRVVADCDVDNSASIRLLERLGFRREAHHLESFWLENEAKWGSEYLYALLQREWMAR